MFLKLNKVEVSYRGVSEEWSLDRLGGVIRGVGDCASI